MKVAYNVQHVIYHHVDAIFRCFSISYCLTIWKIEAATSIPSCRRCQSVAKATFIFYVPEVYWPTPTLFIKYSKHWKQYVISLHIIIPNDFFFFWNACLECNTSVCLSSYVYRVERKENDAHRRCHRLKYTGSAQQLFSLPPPLSLLLPLSFLFLLPFLLLCVVRLFLFWKATSTVAQRKTANRATISRMTRSFSAISFNRCMYLYKEL